MAILPFSFSTENLAPVVKVFPQSAESSPVAIFRRRWIRRAGAVLGAVAVTAGSLAVAANAAKAPVPTANITLPPTLDWQAEYQGQKLCSDWAKPGAVKLSKLLADTYGEYTTYIIRSCSTPGISEHEEGRALDWMVNVEKPEEKAKAESFLNWLTAPGPQGELGAMARRLGIMYLIWDDKMWRVYRPEDGWQEYSGCSNKQSDAYDTSCHRDHIHISLTWDGAYAKTSFWTGKAETRGPCDSSSVERNSGSANSPSVLLNTDSGAGLLSGGCRLGASDSYRDRAYQVTVPVPAVPNPVQRIQLTSFDLNAPEALTIRSAETVTVPQGSENCSVVDVPLDSDGQITFRVGAGYGQVIALGLGNASQAAPAATDCAAPAKPSKPVVSKPVVSKLKGLSAASVRVNTPVTVTGKVRRAPEGSTVKVQSRKVDGKRFRTKASAEVTGKKVALEFPGSRKIGNREIRLRVTNGEDALATSKKVLPLQVLPAVVRLNKPEVFRNGKKFLLTGTVEGTPANGELRLRHRAPKSQWDEERRIKPAANGEYRIRLKLKKPGKHRLQVRLMSGKRLWDSSPRRNVTVLSR